MRVDAHMSATSRQGNHEVRCEHGKDATQWPHFSPLRSRTTIPAASSNINAILAATYTSGFDCPVVDSYIVDQAGPEGACGPVLASPDVQAAS